jgi:hypothetical protein
MRLPLRLSGCNRKSVPDRLRTTQDCGDQLIILVILGVDHARFSQATWRVFLIVSVEREDRFCRDIDTCCVETTREKAAFSAALLTIRLWQLRSKSQFLSASEKQAAANKGKDKMRGVLRCAHNDRHKWIPIANARNVVVSGRTKATALWLVDGLHPTHRKVRDGWGTRASVLLKRQATAIRRQATAI